MWAGHGYVGGTRVSGWDMGMWAEHGGVGGTWVKCARHG